MLDRMGGLPSLEGRASASDTVQSRNEVDAGAAGTAAPWTSTAGLAAMVRCAPEAIACLDGDLRVRLFNRRAEALFGYRAEEILSKSFAMLLHATSDGGASDTLPVLFADDADHSPDAAREFTAIHKDGTEVPAELQVSRIEAEGQELLILVLRDTSKRQLAQEALITAKNEAEIANQAKSEFLANMSHELRNPLNAIIGFSEIIQNEALGPVGRPEYRDYAENIQVSGRHLLKLINDILDLSKIEVGKLALNEDYVNVGETIHACVVLMSGQAREAGVGLDRDLPESLPKVYADERMLRQILINLLSNAVKFTTSGGKVTIKAWDPPGAGLVVQVADTGIGMSLEDIPRAMIRFAQTPSPVSRKFEGSGLGLPLTKSLIELHGGSLDVQSRLGVGTTVTVRLPAERVVSEAAAAAAIS